MRATLLLFLISITSYLLPAQMIGFDEIDPARLSPWRASDWSEYAGVYHFGDSEGESELYLFIDRGRVCAQIQSHEWGEVDGKETWLTLYTNLTEPFIEETRFSSAEHRGKFVVYEDEEGQHEGLRIDNPWTVYVEEGTYEVGLQLQQPNTFDGYVMGSYPQASTRLLRADELTSLTKAELGLMRNEIFARYGYRFRAGGKMATHFANQDWYSAQYSDVNAFLTVFEKKNIALIQSEEKSR